MKLAWSIGHDILHSGAYSDPLGKSEHVLARQVVELGIQIINSLGIGWEVFCPSLVVDPAGKSAGAVLNEKIRKINEFGADIAIESHFNSAGSPLARGCETIYFSLPIGKRFSPEGKRLAECIQRNTLSHLNATNDRVIRPAHAISDRGIKGMSDLIREYNGREVVPRFAFLTQTKMPSVILEPYFISSPFDTALMSLEPKKEVYRLALGVVSGILEWAGVTGVTLPQVP